MRSPRSLLIAALVMVAVLLPSSLTAGDPPAEDDANCSEAYRVVHANWEFCWQLEELRVQGLEILDARYFDERVLWRGGVPFTITRYAGGAVTLGPYKDVLGDARGASVPGFGYGSLPLDEAQCPRWLSTGVLLADDRVCLEKTDGTNPRVAVWSRFDAANYRFVNGWVFHSDGTIEPRLLLGGRLADTFRCTPTGGSHCMMHYHHVYWRLDFDIGHPDGDAVQEFRVGEKNRALHSEPDVNAEPACMTLSGGPWCTYFLEGTSVRDPNGYTRWRVVGLNETNAVGNLKSFEILPGGSGRADSFSTFDAYAVSYRGDSSEIGYEVPSRPITDVDLAKYAMPPEVISEGDVVVWVAEHVIHEPRDEEIPTMPWHTVGLKLRPRNFIHANPGEPSHP